jgi:hypothetical protein
MSTSVRNAARLLAVGAAVAALGVSGTAAAAKAPTKPKHATTKPAPKKAAKKATKKAPATKAVTAHASGVIGSVDAKSHTVTVKVGKASDVFTTLATTKVTVGGKAAGLASLKPGEHATVVYVHSGKALDARTITVAKA